MYNPINNKKIETEPDAHKILNILKYSIPETYLSERKQENVLKNESREVIISEFLVGENNG